MRCRLNDGILFGVDTAAKLMPLTGRNLQFFPQAAGLRAVRDPGRRPVIPAGQYLFAFNQDGAHPPAGAGRASDSPAIGRQPETHH